MKNISLQNLRMPNPSKILILGGTSDARQLADQLITLKYTVIYSIAGLVRTPELNCEIHVGGFSSYGGLKQYALMQQLDFILDATHPYALKISEKAQIGSQEAGVEYIRFERPEWKIQERDLWTMVSNWQAVLASIQSFSTVFLTAGQLPQEVMERLASLPGKFYLRTAVRPKYDIPANVTWIKAIGPFDQMSEKNWIMENQIDLIVSKNSGGSATYGKIAAARELHINVIMFQRPELHSLKGAHQHYFDDSQACIKFINEQKRI